MAAFLEPGVVVTSYDFISLCCGLKGNILGCTICPPRFVVTASIFSGLRGGGRISPSPVPEEKNSLLTVEKTKARDIVE